MNNVKTLEKLHGIAELLPQEERAAFDFCRKHPDEARRVIDSLGVRVALMLADVERDLKSESAKGSGKLAQFKAINRIIKDAKTAPQTALHGAWNADGFQCVCDGFRLVRLVQPLDLEKIPDNVQPIDAARVILGNKHNDGAQLALPDVATLKAYIKTEKARKKASKDKTAPVWDFGDDLPAVNAHFLLDMLEILPDATATVSKQRPVYSGIYFNSDNGDAVLLPIRKAI